MRGWLERLTLGLILAAGAFLRFFHLGRVSLWLDEILSYDVASKAARHLWRGFFTSFEPEHGPLFHASLLIGRLFDAPELSARVAAAIFGTLTIAAVWFLARSLAGALAGMAAAILMAVSPLNVYYSRDGRPYALLMLLTALLVLAVMREWRARWIFLLSFAAAYTSAVAAPLLAAAFLASAIVSVPGRDKRKWLAAIAAASLLILLLYGGSSSQESRFDVRINFDDVVQGLSLRTLATTERSRAAWVVAALALIGAADLVRRDRRRGMAMIVMTLGPIAIGLAVLVYLHHWFSLRYVCSALPGYLVLAGIGMHALASLVPRAAPFVSAVIAVALAFTMIPAARVEPYQKLDWRLIASTIWSHSQQEDMVIATNDWSAISVGFYLQRLPPRVRFITAGESAGAIQALTSRSQPAWVVAAGYYRTNMFPGWLCRYPQLLASPLDSFGLHYAPSRNHFLRERAVAAERRAVAAAFRGAPFTLTFGAEDEALLGSGWAGIERQGSDDVRWAMGTEASAFLPFDTERSHRMHLRVMPLSGPKLPPQQMQVLAGNKVLASITLAPEWHDYDVEVPAHAPQVIRFRFSRANTPASLDPAASDQRPLSVLFTELSIDSIAAVPAGPFAFSVRAQELDAVGAPHDVNENVARHSGKSRFDPRTYDRTALAALAGRSGFDPEFAVPRLRSGDFMIEDLAESLLDRSGCLDDVSFVRNAYWSLIGRSVTEEDARAIVKPWRTPKARKRLVQGLIESGEFADRMKGSPRRAE